MSDLSQVVHVIGKQGPAGISLLGTSFAVDSRKLGTALHVVGPDDTNLVLIAPRINSMSDYQDTSDQQVKAIPLKMVAADPIHDLAILELSSDSQFVFGYQLTSLDSCPPGTAIVTFGFPHANYGRVVLTQQLAHVGARILVENRGQKSKHIVLNTQAREGQSGGPVFSSDLSQIVAILIGSYAPSGGGGISLGGIDPATLHQTTHAISAEYLRAML